MRHMGDIEVGRRDPLELPQSNLMIELRKEAPSRICLIVLHSVV